MPLCIAIVGAGPAGCYAAEAVARVMPDAHIDVIETLPVPYGLVRYGVAPDHQGTKAVTRVLERTLARPTVRIVANVMVGRDVAVGELLNLYDAVILATGASHDRTLAIPGAELPGVIGSGAFVGWYNGHPDHGAAPPLRAVRSAVIVGNGNVALDVARILAKSRDELVNSDIVPAALDALVSTPLQEIHIVGRRGPDAVRVSPHELGELGHLARVVPRVAPPHDAALRTTTPTGDVAKLLHGYAQNDKRGAIDLIFHFELQPARIEGAGRAERFVFTRGDDEVTIPADLIIGCIGYHARLLPGEGLAVEAGCYRNDAGRVAERLYAVGWAARGASGVIPNNRADGLAVAKRIAAEVQPGARPGPAALDALLLERGVRAHGFAACKKIEAAETAAATAPAPRRKFCTIEEMLAATR
jgi:ferredoxin--NADP+ reductase